MTSPDAIRLSEVRLEAVGKRCGGAWVVRDVSIAVGPGEFYTLLGPSGCGNSTLVRMLAGLVAPDVGRIVVDDQPIDRAPPQNRNIGMVFPHGALWPHMSVFDNVAFGLRARRVPAGDVARKVTAALADAGVGERVHAQRPAELATGEARRVALARALVGEPRLLLMDDPLDGLDADTRAEVRGEIARMHRETRITTICATGDQADALALSTRIAVMSEGAVVQAGRPEDIYWKPRSRFVARLVGAANLVPVRVVEHRDVGVVVETAGGVRIPAPSAGHAWGLGDRGLLCLRPEALSVEEAALAPGGIPGRMRSQVFEGARQIYEVDISGATLRIEMLTSALHSRTLRPGDHVKVQISPETSVLLPDETAGPDAEPAEPAHRVGRGAIVDRPTGGVLDGG